VIPRRTPIRKRRAARRGPWRCVDYRRWVASHPCVICGNQNSQAAHTESNGMSSKGPDSSCVPLCLLHHDVLDGRRQGAGCLGLDRSFLRGVAEGFFRAWKRKHARAVYDNHL
jgi:hypothetical protein